MVSFSQIISAVDTHTAGEPTRIILSGLPSIKGNTMAEKKRCMIEPGKPETVVALDTPAGLVEGNAKIEGGRVVEVSVINISSFLYAGDVEIELPGIGKINIDVSFGGNFFAMAPAKALGVSLHPSNISS